MTFAVCLIIYSFSKFCSQLFELVIWEEIQI